MNRRTRRRIRNSLILAFVAVVLVLVERLLEISHWRTAYLTGWLLFGMIVVLALYNFRKQLAIVPLGTSAGWLQFHIYAGLLTGVVFLLHVALRIPNGTFECVLAAAYATTFLSGIVGLAMSRSFPGRLTARGEEVLFERIPVYLKQLRDHVEKVVFKCAEASDTTAISDLYVNDLKSFFERPRNSFWHLVHSSRPRKRLLLAIQSQQRFLADDERDAMETITRQVQRKDDLDYQYALQGALKLWLFVHIPLTYGLLVLSIFHGLAACAYGGIS